MARGLERVAARGDHQPTRQRGIAKSYFRLGGMNVDVDLARVAVEKHNRRAVTLAREIVDVRGPQRARDHLVAHRASVDERELMQRVRLVEGRQTDPPGDAR